MAMSVLVPTLVAQLEEAIKEEVTIVGELNGVASQQPYYKYVSPRLPGFTAGDGVQTNHHEYRYNSKWARSVQNAIGTVIYCGWLGGLGNDSQPGELGRLLTLEQVGEIFNG